MKQFLKLIFVVILASNTSLAFINEQHKKIYHQYIYNNNSNINSDTRNYIINQIDHFSKKHNVPKSLILTTMKVESNFNINARSNADAVGLMQITKILADQYKMNRFDIANNIEMGVMYLKECIDEFGFTHNTVAAYNRGINGVKNNGYYNIKETTDHVKKIKHELDKLNNILYPRSYENVNVITKNKPTIIIKHFKNKRKLTI